MNAKTAPDIRKIFIEKFKCFVEENPFEKWLFCVFLFENFSN